MLGIIAGILSLVGFVPYIVSILQNKTHPNEASWIIWTVVGALLALTYYADGDPNAIWLPFSYFIGPFIVAILSLHYGYSKWSMLDKTCLVAAVISIIPWLLSDNATMTLLINVLIDGAGAIPTLIKSYLKPETEDLTAWVIFFIANTIELFAIKTWNLSATYPLYLFFLVGIIVILITRKQIKNFFNRQNTSL